MSESSWASLVSSLVGCDLAVGAVLPPPLFRFLRTVPSLLEHDWIPYLRQRRTVLVPCFRRKILASLPPATSLAPARSSSKPATTAAAPNPQTFNAYCDCRLRLHAPSRAASFSGAGPASFVRPPLPCVLYQASVSLTVP